MRRRIRNRLPAGNRPRRYAMLARAACSPAIAALLLLLAGCQRRPLKPAMALRSPSSYNGNQAFLYTQPPPHPLVAVELPNKRGQKVKVRTVLSVLFPPPHPVRPALVPPLPPTQLQVQEQPPPTTRPASAGQPTTQPAATSPARPPAATEK